MEQNNELRELMAQAQQQQRCIYAHTDRQGKLFARHCEAGDLMRIYRGIYAETEFWQTLTPPTRTAYLAQTLSIKHQHWVFTGQTAACIRGLDFLWHMLTTKVFIAGDAHHRTDSKQLRRRYGMSHPGGWLIPLLAVTGNHIRRARRPPP